MDTISDPKVITYIITVHGIGEQRDNETLTPVASRFVDVIQDFDGTSKDTYPRNTLSLGQVTGQEQEHNNRYWSAFEGLTMDLLATGKKDFKFYGCEADEMLPDDFIRFTDIYWQDILKEQWKLVGQASDTWISSVVTRFCQDEKHPLRLKSFLYTVSETINILYYASKFKLKNLGTTVFENYLGDVQLYTESPGCRQDAYKHFHKIMNGLEKEREQKPETTNRYFIIAHSLGTIMALDAILDAADKSMPWVDHIEGFITLGSPIDKIITLWDFNYKNLNKLDGKELAKKIPHYNYSDEQDPVGYFLNEIAAKPVYNNAFKKEEDIVYNRFIIPGLAHVKYWTDIELFRHIVRKIIVPKDKRIPFDDSKIWRKKSVYTFILLTTYFLMPTLMTVLNVVTLTLALGADGWQKQIISSLVFVITVWLGKRILSLGISWRLAMNRGSGSSAVSFEQKTTDILAVQAKNFVSKNLLICMALPSVISVAMFLLNPHLTLVFSWPQITPFLVAAFSSLVFLIIFFRKKKQQQAVLEEKWYTDNATKWTAALSFVLIILGICLERITMTSSSLLVSSSDSIELFYYAVCVNLFSCFTYSMLKYISEKKKLKIALFTPKKEDKK